jgi:hypothetical protein
MAVITDAYRQLRGDDGPGRGSEPSTDAAGA